MYVSQRWHGLIKRVHSKDEDKNLEWIHLRVETTPALNIFGSYLVCSPNVTRADEISGMIRNKIDPIMEKGESILLMGDLNRCINTETPNYHTKLLQEWIREGNITLLNNPTIPTRI